ncbi:MAG: hypothetical protein CSA81_08480 [Acidobacteria bacterium]|nr:MAG: hypothetical protein CSA81_08480 [Acidobacteriota bacterium]
MDLFECAEHCLKLEDPMQKTSFSREIASKWRAGEISLNHCSSASAVNAPGKPEQPEIVQPREVPKRKLTHNEGRAAMVHAMAHIEWTAIQLSWDNILRFRNLPYDFYSEWIQTAVEESHHFEELRSCLLEMGFDYGHFPVHDQLWQMALKTKDSLIERMGVVHRIMEARALDVVPGIAGKFDQLGLGQVVKTLHLIANDEVGHVRSSTKWFSYGCHLIEANPDQVFINLTREFFKGPLRGPFNLEARKNAGFTDVEIAFLSESQNETGKLQSTL